MASLGARRGNCRPFDSGASYKLTYRHERADGPKGEKRSLKLRQIIDHCRWLRPILVEEERIGLLVASQAGAFLSATQRAESCRLSNSNIQQDQSDDNLPTHSVIFSERSPTLHRRRYCKCYSQCDWQGQSTAWQRRPAPVPPLAHLHYVMVNRKISRHARHC